MGRPGVAFDRAIGARLARAVGAFARSEVGGRARLLGAALLLLLLSINGLNVVNSYVGRDFVTAIERRSAEQFVTKALLYIGVFAASTVVAVFARFSEDRLALLWRGWLSRGLVIRYLEEGNYYRLKERGEIDNPDQRIAEDVRTFTATTISLSLMLLNASFTIVAFSGVLWSISPLLFGAAVTYAGAGSFLTIALGRRLVGLNDRQFDREAAFRAELVHVRENAESLALLRREARLRDRMLERLDALAANARRIVAVNRNLSFFTTGYNYGIQIVPALIVGPLFIRGDVEFGVITQSAMAFSHLLGAFSLVVTQFQSISSYAAVLNRVSALERATQPDPSRRRTIEVVEDDTRLAYEGLLLHSRLDGRCLLRGLTASFAVGTRALLCGPNEGAKVALFRATAGIWRTGEGRVLRPAGDRLMLLPERPYLPPGTLRQVLVRSEPEGRPVAEERLHATLRALGIESVLARSGGFDSERDWHDLLSLGEHQLLSVARLALAEPRFAVLHRLQTTLGPEAAARAVGLLSGTGMGILELGDLPGGLDGYDAVLEVDVDGSWSWRRPYAAPAAG
jgi:putative ATP-binding cassette transporter